MKSISYAEKLHGKNMDSLAQVRSSSDDIGQDFSETKDDAIDTRINTSDLNEFISNKSAEDCDINDQECIAEVHRRD